MTPWTVACQAPLFMEFFGLEHWSGLPFPSPGDLPHPEIEPRSPALQAESLPTELGGKPWMLRFSTNKKQVEDMEGGRRLFLGRIYRILLGYRNTGRRAGSGMLLEGD